MSRWVEIAFDCLPLRSIARFDAPLGADQETVAKANRIYAAIQMHGSHNTYYLHNAECVFHFTNDPSIGLVAFDFEGVVSTCEQDKTAVAAHLQCALRREDCSWLNQATVEWLKEAINHAVLVEFNHFIQAGDLQRTAERIAALEREMDDRQGFVGMYL
jgi:hypothetical protein